MLGSRVLVFPDTGPDFLRTVRIAALYAEHVGTLTILDKEFATRFCDRWGPDEPDDPLLVKRLRAYFTFVRQHFDELDTFRREGVVSALSLDWKIFKSSREARRKAYSQMREHDKPDPSGSDPEWRPELQRQIQRAFEQAPPCYSDFDLLSPAMRALKGEDVSPILDDLEASCFFSFFAYLLIVAAFAEAHGMAVMSWSRDCRNAMWECRRQFAPEDSGPTARGLGETRLAEAIMRRYLPAVDDLPAAEILTLRERRASELVRFRSAIAELATAIDVTQPLGQMDLQVHDLVAARVDPALRDLRAAIRNSRLDLVMKAGRSGLTAVSAGIPALLAYASGAPLDINLLVALTGASIGTSVSIAAERAKLMNASQWAFLLRLPHGADRS